MTDTFDKDRLEQWRQNTLPVKSAERLKSLPAVAGSQFRLWDGEYKKVWYDVRIPETGEVIRCCWPNAGKMCNFMNDINEQWSAGEIEIRESDKHPLDLHSENSKIGGCEPSSND